MGIENPVHLLFIVAVALIVLGPKRLPQLARALGQGIREFRASLEEGASSEPPGAADMQPASGAQAQAVGEHAPGNAAPPAGAVPPAEAASPDAPAPPGAGA
jgi:TatA/E family protein of Tat protein translocase